MFIYWCHEKTTKLSWMAINIGCCSQQIQESSKFFQFSFMLRTNYCVQASPLVCDIFPSCVNRTSGILSFVFAICNIFLKVYTADSRQDVSQTPSPRYNMYLWIWNPGQHPQWWMWPERCYTWGLLTSPWFSKQCSESNLPFILLCCFTTSSQHGQF